MAQRKPDPNDVIDEKPSVENAFAWILSLVAGRFSGKFVIHFQRGSIEKFQKESWHSAEDPPSE